MNMLIHAEELFVAREIEISSSKEGSWSYC